MNNLIRLNSFTIARKNGVSIIRISDNHPDKHTLMVSSNFSFLLPRNCDEMGGPEFADIILNHYCSTQAIAVAEALRTA